MDVPIRDSRHLHGPDDLATPEQIRGVWRAWEEARARLGRFPVRDAVTLEAAPELIQAYVNDNRWVADCPFCGGGVGCWHAMPDGCCFDCGRVYQVVFPPVEEREQAVAALEFRPFRTRFWKPWEQTARSIGFENIERGYPIPGGSYPEPRTVIDWVRPGDADLVWGAREVPE